MTEQQQRERTRSPHVRLHRDAKTGAARFEGVLCSFGHTAGAAPPHQLRIFRVFYFVFHHH